MSIQRAASLVVVSLVWLATAAASCEGSEDATEAARGADATETKQATTDEEAEMEDREPLAEHAWEDRPLVIFAPSRDDATYRRQVAALEANEEGLQERDVAVYRIFERGESLGPDGPLSEEAAIALRDRFDPREGFTILLVGKDRTEKLRRREVLSGDELFETIDAMPMRRREMRRRQQ